MTNEAISQAELLAKLDLNATPPAGSVAVQGIDLGLLCFFSKSVAVAYLSLFQDTDFSHIDTSTDSPLRDADPDLYWGVKAAELIDCVPFGEWVRKNNWTAYQLLMAYRSMARLILRDHPKEKE